MKRNICLILCAAVLMLQGCGGVKAGGASVQSSKAAEKRTVTSKEIYNRTGRLQREDFYGVTSGTSQVDYSVEYSYNDAGSLTSVKKTGGGLGNDRFIESYLYSGQNCTQKIVYDTYGSTKEIYYWSYTKKGVLEKERAVKMVPDISGSGYSGKTEEVTDFNEDGTAAQLISSSAGDYSKNEYEYDTSGRLISDLYSHSSDGKTWRTFEKTIYAYNEAGLISTEKRYDRADAVYYLRVYEYDDAGNLIKDTVYSPAEELEESIQTQHIYEYSVSGLLSFEAAYSGSDCVQTYYERDAAGNITVKSVTKYSSGEPVDTEVTSTEYDGQGNAVKESVRRGDEEKISFICEYEYYEDGKIRSRTNYAA